MTCAQGIAAGQGAWYTGVATRPVDPVPARRLRLASGFFFFRSIQELFEGRDDQEGREGSRAIDGAGQHETA
jgi:hypothetical protein